MWPRSSLRILKRRPGRVGTIVLLCLLGALLFCLSLPKPKPAPPPPLTAEQKFIAVLNQARHDWIQAPNDVARGDIRANRAKTLCAVLPDGNAQDWTGIVDSVSPLTLPDWHGERVAQLKLRIASGIALATPADPLLNPPDTLLRAGTPLYAAVQGLSPGQAVHFTGVFFHSTSDCMAETSLTTAGSLRAPSFKFALSAISPQ